MNNIENKFKQLHNQWKEETKYFSSVQEITENKNFKEIVNLGKKVIPFIIEQLKIEQSFLTVALKQIINEDPVKENHYGIPQAITNDWIEWYETTK
jgi:hypothetical protein